MSRGGEREIESVSESTREKVVSVGMGERGIELCECRDRGITSDPEAGRERESERERQRERKGEKEEEREEERERSGERQRAIGSERVKEKTVETYFTLPLHFHERRRLHGATCAVTFDDFQNEL